MHTATPGLVSFTDATCTVDDAVGGKVRPGYMLHQFTQSDLRVVQHSQRAVYDLCDVVWRDIGSHAHGDTG